MKLMRPKLELSISNLISIYSKILFVILFSPLLIISTDAFAQNNQINIQSINFLKINMSSNAASPYFAGTNINPSPLNASIEVTYSYDGTLGPVYIGAKAIGDNIEGSYYERPAGIGNNIHQELIITRPDSISALNTTSIEVFIYTKNPLTQHKTNLTIKNFPWFVNWPAQPIREQFAKQNDKDYEKNLLADAIQIIDSEKGGSDLDVAKRNLDIIISKNPNNAQAYLELARIAMKSDSSATERTRYAGLDEGTRLIKVALKIDPNSANAHILYGYVLAVQKQADQAISEFKKAQQIGTKNMWLYYNWGLALENGNKPQDAIKKYQEGVALTPVADTPETHSNNRAIPEIFSKLLKLLEEKNDLTGIDSLYKKRIAVLDESCQKTFYGQFKLYKMGDYNAAIDLGTKAHEQNCHSGARPLIAAAYLTKWALDPSKMSTSERETLFNRAQAFITDTQQTIIELASSPATVKVLPKLKNGGFDIDAPSANMLTPLAYAAANGNTQAVQGLISAGANPDVILRDGWTPLMIAVASEDEDTVATLLNAKVNIDRTTKDGQSAKSIAKKIGNTKIIKLLNNKSAF